MAIAECRGEIQRLEFLKRSLSPGNTHRSNGQPQILLCVILLATPQITSVRSTDGVYLTIQHATADTESCLRHGGDL